jgi:hypothetical protein
MKFVALLLCLGTASAAAQDFDRAAFEPAVLQALISRDGLDEISGIAASRRSDDLYWVHNDAPRPARIDAVDGKGDWRGELRLEGVRAVDWEDIASFELDGKPWLLIGDIGDNAARRKDYELILVEEPSLSAETSPISRSPAWRLRFRYPDGAHDVEAMAVDAATRQVLLISKHPPVRVYSLPLAPGGRLAVVAQQRLELDFLPQPTASERQARFPSARMGGSPTAFDIDRTNRRAALLTYRDIWLFERRAEETWWQALARRPQHLDLPPMAQAEAIAFDRAGQALLVSGERLPAPLLRYAPSVGTGNGNGE